MQILDANFRNPDGIGSRSPGGSNLVKAGQADLFRGKNFDIQGSRAGGQFLTADPPALHFGATSGRRWTQMPNPNEHRKRGHPPSHRSYGGTSGCPRSALRAPALRYTSAFAVLRRDKSARRARWRGAGWIVPPCQGWDGFWGLPPGRCPGLSCSGLSGRREWCSTICGNQGKSDQIRVNQTNFIFADF
jgi:hypothetical protein